MSWLESAQAILIQVDDDTIKVRKHYYSTALNWREQAN